MTFDHWDLWFLVALVVDHDGDWNAMRGRFFERVRGPGFERDDAEAKLSHLDDLERRVAAAGAEPAALVEVADKRLAAKAHDKLFRQHVEEHHKTRAMRDTPRRLLRERALRGHWPRFPVSPASYEAGFTVERGPGAFHSERAAMGAARKLSHELAAADTRTNTVAERLALYRAFMTVHLDVMAHANDSCGTLGELFAEKLSVYVALDWRQAGVEPDAYLRDFLELATWEEYALMDDLGGLFGALEDDEALAADSILREIADEVRMHGFEYQEEQALAHLASLFLARGWHHRFVEHAARMGSRAWKPILSMAEAAWKAGKRNIALQVFAAADQPGFHRENLRRHCVELCGVLPPPRKPILASVP